MLLDVGISPGDLHTFILGKLSELGEQVDDLEITEIDLNPFNTPANDTASICVEDAEMVPRLKRLDGLYCLGRRLTVRRMTEDSVQQSAQASAIAIQALMELQGQTKRFRDPEAEKANPEK